LLRRHYWPTVAAPYDRYIEACGETRRIESGNRNTRRKPASASRCPPQTLHMIWTRTRVVAVRSRRLTASAMADIEGKQAKKLGCELVNGRHKVSGANNTTREARKIFWGAQQFPLTSFYSCASPTNFASATVSHWPARRPFHQLYLYCSVLDPLLGYDRKQTGSHGKNSTRNNRGAVGSGVFCCPRRGKHASTTID
jgi:hypothetical protein